MSNVFALPGRKRQLNAQEESSQNETIHIAAGELKKKDSAHALCLYVRIGMDLTAIAETKFKVYLVRARQIKENICNRHPDHHVHAEP